MSTTFSHEALKTGTAILIAEIDITEDEPVTAQDGAHTWNLLGAIAGTDRWVAAWALDEQYPEGANTFTIVDILDGDDDVLPVAKLTLGAIDGGFVATLADSAIGASPIAMTGVTGDTVMTVAYLGGVITEPGASDWSEPSGIRFARNTYDSGWFWKQYGLGDWNFTFTGTDGVGLSFSVANA